MNDTITIVGNLADDPTHTVTPAGLAITSFRVASTRGHFDKSQDRWVEDGTNWYSVSAFRGLARNAHASLRKGQRIVVHGRVKMREWDNGTKKGTSVDIEADAVGHDLQFGTSAFTRTSPRRAPESGDAMGGEPFPDDTRVDSWAVAPVDGWAREQERPVAVASGGAAGA